MKTKLMMMAAAVAVAFGAWADTETVGDYTWTYWINGDTAEIYGPSFPSPAISPSPTGAVTIPSTLGGKPVTSIGYDAFYGCSGLTSVTIPNSVTSIGDGAFYYCSGLTSVTIGNGVTSIARSAFEGCTNVTDVVVPGWKCTIPFNAVTNLVISKGTTSIGDIAFYNCSGLTSVTIPDSVTSIGDRAFYNCSGLTSIAIPNSVTNIGSLAFFNCNGLMSISVADDNPNYKSINGLLLSKDGTTLIQGLNMDVAIPGSVTNIGNYAFYNCGGLTSVTIPDGVTSIGDSAFSGCGGLTSVTIPDGVTSIGASAFSGCGGLMSVTIPDSVTSLPSSAFDGCGRLWTAWYRTLANSSSAGGGSSGGGSAEPVDPRYALAASPADRAIASVTVDRDCAIDSFVLKDGKVYDSVLRIVNTSAGEVRLTLPAGYVYETFKGAKPLTIPANSRNILTITRTTGDTFLVSREELETVQ